MEIRRVYSSNGGGDQVPERAVIHAMSEYIECEKTGVLYHAVEFLEKIGLSAHLLHCPDGQIIETRPFDKVGWHAKGHNQDTVGIEFLLEGVNNLAGLTKRIEKPYLTHIQYRNGVDYIKEHVVNGLGILNFTRHSVVDPARKTDPGEGFPWTEFLGDIGLIYKEP